MIPVLHIQKVKGIAGSENHLLDLLPLLPGQGFAPEMVVLADREDRPQTFEERLLAQDIPVHRFTLGWDADPLAAWRLRRWLANRRPALVHTHLIHADLYGRLATPRASGGVLISSKHSATTWGRRRLYLALDRLATARASRVIAISRAVADWHTATGCVPAEKLRVVLYGLDGERFRREHRPFAAGFTPDDFVVCTVSRLIPVKGLEVLIAAFSRVVERCPRAVLAIAGDGPELPRLQEQVAALGLQGRVRLFGHLGSSEISGLLGQAHLFALPTFSEGFGLVLLEAMAWDLPVVASRVTSIPEIVLDGHTGLLVPPGEVNALADALLALAADPDRARAMGSAGRRRLEAEFSLDAMAAGTAAVYREALGAGGSRWSGRER